MKKKKQQQRTSTDTFMCGRMIGDRMLFVHCRQKMVTILLHLIIYDSKRSWSRTGNRKSKVLIENTDAGLHDTRECYTRTI